MNIDFPLSFDAHGRTAATDSDNHLRDMIEQLLFTRPGERVNRPDFGSGLMHMVFAPNASDSAATLQFTLQAALQRWLGDLFEVSRLEVTIDDARLEVDVEYLVRRTGERRLDMFTQELPHG